MQSQPLVSVVLPVFNPAPDLFSEAVRSICRQTLGDWELVIVEDPGERSAAPTLSAIGNARIRHTCNSVRTSFSQQLNLGLSLCRAPIVARMDADDLCEPNRLAAQLEFLSQHPDVDIVGSSLTVIDTSGRPIGVRQYPQMHQEIVAALPRYSPLAHPAVMFRKEAVVRIGGYQGEMCTADYDLWNRLHLAGAHFANLPQPLLRYRVHPQGMKTEKLREMLVGTLNIKRKYWSGKLNLAGQLRMAIERSLLVLPASLVLRLFLLTHLRAPAPVV